MTAERDPPRRPLRRTVLLVLVPLGLVVTTGIALQWWLARAVHRDVVRLFEELREVALAHTLVDELRGVEQWIEQSPAARAAADTLVFADVAQHRASARATLQRFTRAADPSRPDHDAAEARLLAQVGAGLAEVDRALASDAALGELREPLAVALHAALAVSRDIDAESHLIGDALDRRSNDMVQLLVLLGLVSVATVGGLGWLLLRQVLEPVRQLRDEAVRFGAGGRDLQLPIDRPDELGDLAHAFARMADQLQAQQRDLEQRVEARSREVLRTAQLAQLGTLAAGIAHEINNPLASIVACSDGLLREIDAAAPDPTDLREYLAIVRKEALRARDITTKLLRFAHPGRGAQELFWPAAELREVATLFAHQLADAGVAFVLDAAEPGPAMLGHAAEWRQVCFNLLKNALDASPRGARIRASCRRAGDRVEMTIADAGPGVPAAVVDHIFEPFFTTKDPGKGTGLGLAIVHRIVTAHGGRIRVDDAAPGARFTITMPAADAAS